MPSCFRLKQASRLCQWFSICLREAGSVLCWHLTLSESQFGTNNANNVMLCHMNFTSLFFLLLADLRQMCFCNALAKPIWLLTQVNANSMSFQKQSALNLGAHSVSGLFSKKVVFTREILHVHIFHGMLRCMNCQGKTEKHFLASSIAGSWLSKLIWWKCEIELLKFHCIVLARPVASKISFCFGLECLNSVDRLPWWVVLDSGPGWPRGPTWFGFVMICV